MTRYAPWTGSSRNNTRNQQRYEERRAMLDQMKTNRGCDRCGYNVYPGALDWDHRPDEVKAFPVSSGWSRSYENLLAEIAKCDLLCSNCHRMVTHGRRTWANGWSKNMTETHNHPQLFEDGAA
jgi:hypothetical protein